MKRFILIVFISVLFPLALFADFGLVLSEGLLVEEIKEFDFASKTTLAPWFSFPLGPMDFYISVGLSANYENGFVFIPELQRLEFNLRTHPVFGFRLGRIPWQDPSLFTAKGFFDGIDAYANLGPVHLGFAAFYTGLLFKNTGSINISPGDPTDYSLCLDWNDFQNTYFAPRRFFASLYGDFPFLPLGRGNINAGILAQFDLGDADEAFHTQYLLLRYTLGYKRFDLTACGAAELENTGKHGFRTAYAFSLETGFQTGFFIDRLSLGLRWASGEGTYTAAFFPVIREAQGFALRPIFSGIMVFRANYQARFLPSFAAQLGGRYFLRTDSESFYDSGIKNDSYLLGAEVDGGIHWIPFSDLSISLVGGMFFPQTGKAFGQDTPLRWSVTLRAIFSF